MLGVEKKYASMFVAMLIAIHHKWVQNLLQHNQVENPSFSGIHLRKLNFCINWQTQIGRIFQICLANENSLSTKLKILGESPSKAAIRRCSIKKVFLKIFLTPVLESLFDKVGSSGLQDYKRETPTQVFCSEFCKFFRIPFLQNISRRLLLSPCFLILDFLVFSI